MYILEITMLPLMILNDNKIQYAQQETLTDDQYGHFTWEERPMVFVGRFKVSVLGLRTLTVSDAKMFIENTFYKNMPKYLSLDMPAKIAYQTATGLDKYFIYEIVVSQLWIEPLDAYKDLYEEVYLKDVGWCYLYDSQNNNNMIFGGVLDAIRILPYAGGVNIIEAGHLKDSSVLWKDYK